MSERDRKTRRDKENRQTEKKKEASRSLLKKRDKEQGHTYTIVYIRDKEKGD